MGQVSPRSISPEMEGRQSGRHGSRLDTVQSSRRHAAESATAAGSATEAGGFPDFPGYSDAHAKDRSGTGSLVPRLHRVAEARRKAISWNRFGADCPFGRSQRRELALDSSGVRDASAILIRVRREQTNEDSFPYIRCEPRLRPSETLRNSSSREM